MRAVVALMMVCILTGCASTQRSYRPFSESEKQKFADGIKWAALDVITTQYALSDNDATEANPIVRDLIVDHEVEFMAIKAVQAAAFYGIAHRLSDPRQRYLALDAYIWSGKGPALWNLAMGFKF